MKNIKFHSQILILSAQQFQLLILFIHGALKPFNFFLWSAVSLLMAWRGFRQKHLRNRFLNGSMQPGTFFGRFWMQILRHCVKFFIRRLISVFGSCFFLRNYLVRTRRFLLRLFVGRTGFHNSAYFVLNFLFGFHLFLKLLKFDLQIGVFQSKGKAHIFLIFWKI